MSDHDTLTPETDDQLRARLQAFAQEVKERTDTEAALERMPRRSRPPTIRLVAIAACFVLAVAIAAVVMADRQSVDTVPPAESPTTECPPPTQPRAIPSGGQMKMRFAAPVASAATAIVLLGACSDDGPTTPAKGEDGPTTLAKGEDVNFVGGLLGPSGQTMDINAEEEDGEVTGEARFSPAGLTLALQCADTDTDGLVIVGGEATADAGDSSVGDRVAVIIRVGDPDRAVLWFEDPLPEGEVAAGSCREFLDAIPEAELNDESSLADIAEGDDIETG